MVIFQNRITALLTLVVINALLTSCAINDAQRNSIDIAKTIVEQQPQKVRSYEETLQYIKEELKSEDSLSEQKQVHLLNRLDEAEKIRSLINTDLISMKQISKTVDLDQLLQKLERDIIRKGTVSELRSIKNRAQELTPDKVISQVKQNTDNYNGNSTSPGPLTRLIIRINNISDQLSSLPSISYYTNAEEIREIKESVQRLKENLQIYRLGCFSKYILDEIERIRDRTQNNSASNQDWINAYITLSCIQLSSNDIAYGVNRELQTLKDKIFNSYLEDKPKIRARAHQELIDIMFSRRKDGNAMRPIISINNF